MILLSLIQAGWSCDPAMGSPSELYPQDESMDVSLDTHILLKMIHMTDTYVPYNIVLRKNTNGTLEDINGASSIECLDTIGWDGICWVRFVPDEHLEVNQNYLVNIEAEYDYMSEIQTSFTTGNSLISNEQSVVNTPTLEYLDQEFFPYDDFCGTPAEYRLKINISGLNPSSTNQNLIYLYQSDEDGQNAILRNARAMLAENHNMHLDIPESTSGEGCLFVNIRNIKNELLIDSEVICTPMSDSSEEIYLEDPFEETEKEEVESGCTKLSSSPSETFIISTILLLCCRRRK